MSRFSNQPFISFSCLIALARAIVKWHLSKRQAEGCIKALRQESHAERGICEGHLKGGIQGQKHPQTREGMFSGIWWGCCGQDRKPQGRGRFSGKGGNLSQCLTVRFLTLAVKRDSLSPVKSGGGGGRAVSNCSASSYCSIPSPQVAKPIRLMLKVVGTG